MNPGVAFALGAVIGALVYHLLLTRTLSKATGEAIANAEESMEKTTSLRGDLSKIQEALESELEACRVMRQEMRVHIADAEELSRVTGILSYAWPAQADIVIYSRTSGCCRGVDPSGATPLVRLQDLFAKIPDLDAFTQELRIGVRRAPEDTGATPAEDQVSQEGRV